MKKTIVTVFATIVAGVCFVMGIRWVMERFDEFSASFCLWPPRIAITGRWNLRSRNLYGESLFLKRP
jgi:hypothetical protein